MNQISHILNHLRPSNTANTHFNSDLTYVLITGCSRGIGHNVVKQLLQEKNSKKYYVIASCRSPHKANKLRWLIADHDNASLIKLDISDEKSIKDSLIKVLCITNKIDVLINNAAISVSNHPYESVLDFDGNEMNNAFKTNVIGTGLMVQHYFELLKRNKNGKCSKVINLSSELASLERAMNAKQSGNANRMTCTTYRITKVSINMLTRLQAGELGDRYNIIFTAVNPGWVDTELGSTHNRTPPINVFDAAKGIINLMENMKLHSHNGQYFDFKGQKLPW